MMMVREQVATDGMLPVLEKIARLGYNSVEVSQVPTDEANVAALEKGRSELGVEVAALSVALQKGPTATGDALDTDFDKVVGDCRAKSSTAGFVIIAANGIMPIRRYEHPRRRQSPTTLSKSVSSASPVAVGPFWSATDSAATSTPSSDRPFSSAATFASSVGTCDTLSLIH